MEDAHLIRIDLRTLKPAMSVIQLAFPPRRVSAVTMLLGRSIRLRGRPTRLNAWSSSYFHTSPVAWAKVLRTFKLADIGEGITECEVIRWYVALVHNL